MGCHNNNKSNNNSSNNNNNNNSNKIIIIIVIVIIIIVIIIMVMKLTSFVTSCMFLFSIFFFVHCLDRAQDKKGIVHVMQVQLLYNQ